MRHLPDSTARTLLSDLADAITATRDLAVYETERADAFRLIHDRVMHQRHTYRATQARALAARLIHDALSLAHSRDTLRSRLSQPSTPPAATRAAAAPPQAPQQPPRPADTSPQPGRMAS